MPICFNQLLFVCTRAGGGLGLALGVLHPSTLFTEAGSQPDLELTSTAGFFCSFLSIACSGDSLSLPSEAGIQGELSYPPGIYMGSGNRNSCPPAQHKCFIHWAISSVSLLLKNGKIRLVPGMCVFFMTCYQWTFCTYFMSIGFMTISLTKRSCE